MEWEVAFHDDFEEEFDELSDAVQDAILAEAKLLAKVGPSLKRPHADFERFKAREHERAEMQCG